LKYKNKAEMRKGKSNTTQSRVRAIEGRQQQTVAEREGGGWRDFPSKRRSMDSAFMLSNHLQEGRKKGKEGRKKRRRMGSINENG
jgi:hypothetical protein